MKRVELTIGEYPNQSILDLSKDAISIALQYSIDDVRNIEKKNTNYSKTITLPGTKKNNDIFGNLFDVNSTFDKFNPNIKRSAVITIDSSPVLEGYIQLTSVKKLNNRDLQGNQISYEVIVFDDSIDFFQTIGDELVSSMNFSGLNHTYGQTAIENAWNNHDYTNIYQYPLMDKNSAGYATEDFKPAFYHKGLLLQIAKDAGYSLTGGFINLNGQYEREIIAWDGETPEFTDEEILDRKFKVNMAAPSTVIGSFSKDSWGSVYGKIQGSSNYDDKVSGDNFDNTGDYNANGTQSYWEVTQNSKHDFTISSNVKLEIFNPTAPGGFIYSEAVPRPAAGALSISNVKYMIRASIRDLTTGAEIASDAKIIGNTVTIPYNTTQTLQKDFTFNLLNINVTSGMKLYVEYTLTASSSFGYSQSGSGYNRYTANPVTITMTTFNSLLAGGATSFFNEPALAANVINNDTIELNLYLPKKLKKKDLFTDIIRRYNVYIRRHPTLSKTLILETRDDYYNTNVEVLDWTQKKDYSSEDKIEFLSDLQNKEILFTYKEDKEALAADAGKYNEQYTLSTGDIYGQKKIEFNNDFVKGEKKIESIFSTIPLVFRGNIGNNVVVPALTTEDNTRNPVLLYWGGMKAVKDETGAPQSLTITWGAFNPITYSTYPYAGHYNDPYTPNLDIHYGEVTFEYYGVLLQNITDNTLFNSYWRNYYDQISAGKLITSTFYLRETDINFIKDNLNARIFVKDSYYNINKIIDYKPLEDGLTKVELLKIDKGSTFTPQNYVVGSVPNWTTLNNSDQFQNGVNNTTNSGPISTLPNNNINSVNVVTVGTGNYVGGGTTGIINGNDNSIGNNSTGINITGNGNTVGSGLENVTIIGNGVTVTESNTTYINGTTFTSGSTVGGLWERSAGIESIVQINTLAPNFAEADYSVITGSINQTATGCTDSFIGGGNNHIISGTSENAAIIGGNNNTLSGDSENSAIIGGSNNITSGPNSSIIGGTLSNISSNGTLNNIFGGSFVLIKDVTSNNNVFGATTSTISGPAFNNTVVGSINADISGPSSNNTIIGGVNPNISNPSSYNTFIGGSNNTMNFASYSYMLGGSSNSLTGGGSAPGPSNSGIIGGTLNTTDHRYSLILNSSGSTISRVGFASDGEFNNILGGEGNTITVDTNDNNTILGGKTNTVSSTANNSVILGGQNITATQDETAYVPNFVIKNNLIPTSVADTAGEVGQISHDAVYVYVKTTTGWGKLKIDYGVFGAGAVASTTDVNGDVTFFGSLKDAYDDSTSANVVNLLTDYTETTSSPITLVNGRHINLNGYKYTYNIAGTDDLFTLASGSVHITNGFIHNALSTGHLFNNSGTLSVNGVTTTQANGKIFTNAGVFRGYNSFFTLSSPSSIGNSIVNSNIIEGGEYTITTDFLQGISDTSINVKSKDFKLTVANFTSAIWNTLPQGAGLGFDYENVTVTSGPTGGGFSLFGLNGCHLRKCTINNSDYREATGGGQPIAIPVGNFTFIDCIINAGPSSIVSLGPQQAGVSSVINTTVTGGNGILIGLSNTVAENCTFNAGIVSLGGTVSKMIGGTINGNNTTTSPVSMNGDATMQGVEINTAAPGFAAIDATSAGGKIVNCNVTGSDTLVDFGAFKNLWANPVYVPKIAFNNDGSGWVFVEIEIGDWNMDTTTSLSVSHALSATEYKTVRQASTEIRDDADTIVSHNFYNGTEGHLNATTSTAFNLTRNGGGIYDSTSFSTTSFNRGWISFWYQPD